MINYNKSIIYKICCNDLKIKEIYIGSTTNFTKRKQLHKSCCNNINGKLHHLKLYKCIRDNGGWVNWSMILIDTVSCESKLELHKIEREYIEKNNSVLNCNIPCRTAKEQKEKKKEYHKQYYEDNREKRNEYDKKYYQKNKQYNNYNEYYKKYSKKYYQKNKQKINEKLKEKITCECGATITKCNKPRHNKTKKHINFINNNK